MRGPGAARGLGLPKGDGAACSGAYATGVRPEKVGGCREAGGILRRVGEVKPLLLAHLVGFGLRLVEARGHALRRGRVAEQIVGAAHASIALHADHGAGLVVLIVG